MVCYSSGNGRQCNQSPNQRLHGDMCDWRAPQFSVNELYMQPHSTRYKGASANRVCFFDVLSAVSIIITESSSADQEVRRSVSLQQRIVMQRLLIWS